MKAFVSYRHGTNISVVFDILKNHGIEFFDSNSDIMIGNSLQEAISKGVQECDFFVTIYESANANTAFEIGLAYALKKPIFAIINASGQEFPDFLIEAVHVQSRADDYEKIKYSFDIFIKNIKPKKKSTTTKHRIAEKSVFQDWLEIYNSIEQKNEITLEKFISEILEKYKIEVIENKWNKDSSFIADFCIWSDPLSNSLGNPILIEVKREIHSRNLKLILSDFAKALDKTNAKTGIVFYDYLTNVDKNELINKSSSRLLFIEIKEFLQTLNNVDFNQAIINTRNKTVHNF
jgi:nucleoside 2-deoxyribosyltransferase